MCHRVDTRFSLLHHRFDVLDWGLRSGRRRQAEREDRLDARPLRGPTNRRHRGPLDKSFYLVFPDGSRRGRSLRTTVDPYSTSQKGACRRDYLATPEPAPRGDRKAAAGPPWRARRAPGGGSRRALWGPDGVLWDGYGESQFWDRATFDVSFSFVSVFVTLPFFSRSLLSIPRSSSLGRSCLCFSPSR